MIERMSSEVVASFASLIERDECIIDLLLEYFILKLERTTISEVSRRCLRLRSTWGLKPAHSLTFMSYSPIRSRERGNIRLADGAYCTTNKARFLEKRLVKIPVGCVQSYIERSYQL
jgi:hypothetical protein